jgi:hypothetical protein
MRTLAILLLVAACGTDHAPVIGPFSGTTHRYTLDAIRLPTTNTEARDLAEDLTGDSTPDNQLGFVVVTLREQGNVTEHSSDMILGGAMMTSLEITADNLDDDSTVGVRYLGAQDSPYVELGGTIVDGTFVSNRVAMTHVWGEAELHLPVFLDADPSVVSATGMQIVLVPDGIGGFDAAVQAAIPTGTTLIEEVHRGIAQMVASEPSDHRMLMRLLDENRDGQISYEEVANKSLLASLLARDMVLDGRDVISFGFQAHFRPCDAGTCTESVPFDHCFDRARDGDETDIDCGGSCRRCESNAACVVADDCESLICDGTRCGPPSCMNGTRDGLESDVDCGGDCPSCALGQGCYFNTDCVTGECGTPCVSDNAWDCASEEYEYMADVCYPRP